MNNTLIRKTKIILEMIKFEHTIFALPFAFLGAILAAGKLPSLSQCFFILLAMIGARSAAMAFNRVVDEPFDRENPRTKGRALPKGLLSRSCVSAFIVISSLIFLFSAYMLNKLSFILAFPALAFILFYSYTKRFTSFSHFILGIADSIAPAGGWIAIKGTFSIDILSICALVATWVAGFDILYSCQDIDFDSRMGLYSIPGRFGIKKALTISFILHFFTICFTALMLIVFHLGWLAIAGSVLFSIILIWEHVLIKTYDLSKINIAFFTLNGFFSIGLFLFIFSDILLN